MAQAASHDGSGEEVTARWRGELLIRRCNCIFPREHFRCNEECFRSGRRFPHMAERAVPR